MIDYSKRFENEFEQPKNDTMEIIFGVAIGLALVPMLWLTTIVLYGIFGG
jgi:hypothetical protein